MRRRNRQSQGLDSLELLLDTICNMFGGVIFIAILLAVLAGRPGSAAVSREHRAADIKALEEEVRGLENSLATARSVDSVDSDVDAAVSSLIRARATAEQRLTEAQAQLERLRAVGSSLQERAASIRDRREVLSREIRQRESEISQQKRLRVSAARLPASKMTSKIPIHIVLRGSRAYEIYANDGRGGYVEQPLDVKIAMSGQQDQVHRVRLKDSGGFLVDRAVDSHVRWRTILGRISAERHFFYLLVSPSGYDSFMLCRDAALRAGIEYDLILMDEDQEITLTPGSDFGTQ